MQTRQHNLKHEVKAKDINVLSLPSHSVARELLSLLVIILLVIISGTGMP